MEFGLFLFLSLVGIIGYVRRSLTFTTLSVAVFFILAVYLSTGEQVTYVNNTNSTTTTRNATGSVTVTENTSGSDTAVVLGSNLLIVSYIFFAAGIAATILCIRAFIGYVAWV